MNPKGTALKKKIAPTPVASKWRKVTGVTGQARPKQAKPNVW